MLKIRYEVTGDEARLDFCDRVGLTAVDNMYIVRAQRQTVATMTGATLLVDTCPSLRIHLGAPEIGDLPHEGTVPVLIDTGADQLVHNFQFGLAHDNPAVTVNGVEEGAALLETGAADIFIHNVVEGGVTAGAILVNLPGKEDGPIIGALPACTANQEVARVNYVYRCGLLEAKETSLTATLTANLGSPPVAITIGIDGASVTPGVGESQSLTLVCVEPFVRGDATHNGIVNISDALAMSKAVFGLGQKYDLIALCLDSADANDDGRFDVADPIFVLQYLWARGPPIPPPNVCGIDQTPSSLPPCAASGCP
jgi:hypothetical protein